MPRKAPSHASAFPARSAPSWTAPFWNTGELVAGFLIWQVKSKEEAIELVKRRPNPFPGGEPEIEIRQVFESDGFGEALTRELRG